MKIDIREEDRRIVISTDELDNYNYVDVTICVDDGNMIKSAIPIEELYTAAKAFHEMRTRRIKHDNLIR